MFALALFLACFATAQCNIILSTFPYNEGFESSMGNWFVSPSSINSDWAWGTPSKSIITGAGGGLKSWITGGLTGNSYNNGEASYLQSPCFDISSLKNPQISFKVFWETESGYDGAGFQYSTDGGFTWSNLGSVNDYTACQVSNWFNDPSVRYLVTGEGWSGSSGKWVTATHSLSDLKGATSVAFRFAFGAGIINNNYNGFAIDDIFIGEGPSSFDFIYTCQQNKTVNFVGQSTACAPDFAWNFGDTASYAENTSSNENPSHTFSTPGTYTVVLVANGTTVKKSIKVSDITINVNDVTCHGAADGEATVIVSPGDEYTYTWNTNPIQNTATISHLAPGVYSVMISGANACPVTEPVTIAQPDSITASVNVTNETCSNKKGAVTSNITGGVVPYAYLWSDSETLPGINNLAANKYTLKVTDAKNCQVAVNNIIVNDISRVVPVSLGEDTVFCPGQTLVLHPGLFSSYLWQDGSVSSAYTVSTTGIYKVTVTDSNGCKGSASLQVTVDCSDIFFPSAFTPNSDGKNDSFGPAGNLAGVSSYSFSVYNRWGQRVFYTTNPFLKWNGVVESNPVQNDVYIWFANYSIHNGEKQFRKGTVISIR